VLEDTLARQFPSRLAQSKTLWLDRAALPAPTGFRLVRPLLVPRFPALLVKTAEVQRLPTVRPTFWRRRQAARAGIPDPSSSKGLLVSHLLGPAALGGLVRVAQIALAEPVEAVRQAAPLHLMVLAEFLVSARSRNQAGLGGVRLVGLGKAQGRHAGACLLHLLED
jgi:hypothetical protein